MFEAAIDVGSNTVRMLLANRQNNQLIDPQYYRQVTRLAGGLHPRNGLNFQSMERTLHALTLFSNTLKVQKVKKVQIVGTEALRSACNSQVFLEQVSTRLNLDIKIIDGDTEARLSCLGMLSVLESVPEHALLFDVGGGSTEIILFADGKVLHQCSLPLGAVRLFECSPAPMKRQAMIQKELQTLSMDPAWQYWRQQQRPAVLIGTAGTVTTLAALNLKMMKYDGQRVNNLILERDWLNKLSIKLNNLSSMERLSLLGMEKGREDIIIPGLQLVMSLLDQSGTSSLVVADAGILEGILLEGWK